MPGRLEFENPIKGSRCVLVQTSLLSVLVSYRSWCVKRKIFVTTKWLAMLRYFLLVLKAFSKSTISKCCCWNFLNFFYMHINNVINSVISIVLLQSMSLYWLVFIASVVYFNMLLSRMFKWSIFLRSVLIYRLFSNYFCFFPSNSSQLF